MTNRVGQQLGNYRLVRLLGQGGFADVYLGKHIHLETQAAIKVLHTQLTSENVEKFRIEARTIAHLEHPHIVRVLEFGVDGTTPFLVMSYAPKGSLRKQHPKGTRLAFPTVLAYTKQVADALQYAHQQKLIHRDVKPENMLLGRSNEVLLSDFNLAIVAQSSTSQSMEMAGTVPYMAPEQLHGKPRPASDQYALGVVVYEWLSGSRPFRGPALEIATQHMLAPPPPLREQNPAIPSDVEEVVLIALAKDPQRRFASVKAFANALEQASLSGVPLLSSSTIPLEFSATPSLATLPLSVPPSVELTESSASMLPTPPLEQTLSNSLPSIFPSVSDVPSISKIPAQSRISRRAIIAGLAGLAAVGMAGTGGLVWWVLTPHPLYTYHGHFGSVYDVAWSPAGTRIASTSEDKTVKVWDAVDGSHVFTYHGHSRSVSTVAWSPNGKFIASTSDDNTVQIWVGADASHVFTYAGHSRFVNAAVWSPDGKRIVSGSTDKTVQVWEAATGNTILTYRGHTNFVYDVAWSPDGTRIASAGKDKTVQVWEAATGNTILTYHGHTNSIFALAWSPNSKRIASGGFDDTVQVWNAADGEHVYTYRGHSDTVWAVAWSPDGTRLASASADGTVQVWNATDGGHVYPYRGHTANVGAVAWSPDGKLIASGSTDKTVQVWQAP